jgi:hypothetical protein
MSKEPAMTSGTRRMIVFSLLIVACLALVVDLVLRLNDKETSDAILALAAVSVGALGGMAVPHAADDPTPFPYPLPMENEESPVEPWPQGEVLAVGGLVPPMRAPTPGTAVEE